MIASTLQNIKSRSFASEKFTAIKKMMLLQSRLADWNYLPVLSKSLPTLWWVYRKEKKSCVYSFRLVPENTDRPPTQIYHEADQVQASGSPFILAGNARKQAHVCGFCFFFFFWDLTPTPPNTHNCISFKLIKTWTHPDSPPLEY